METPDIILTPDKIPPSFARCFMGDCPMADTCARHFASQYIPATRIRGEAVFPTARQADGTCRMYKEKRIVQAAYGFTNLFAEVKKKDDTPLRNRIKHFLGGHATYYRFHHGERLLMPEQQQWILDLFRSKGYTGNLQFDGYVQVYDFT